MASNWTSAIQLRLRLLRRACSFSPSKLDGARRSSSDSTFSKALTLTVSDPVGQEVQTPPCFTQNEQVHARAGISDGSGRQSSANEILPQWQRPEINIALPQ